jgi:hypothetical protein
MGITIIVPFLCLSFYWSSVAPSSAFPSGLVSRRCPPARTTPSRLPPPPLRLTRLPPPDPSLYACPLYEHSSRRYCLVPAWCSPRANTFLPSFLTFSPNTRHTCVPFTITKLTSPTSTARFENRWPQATAHQFTEWRRCKASYVPHTSRHVAAVLRGPSAPIELHLLLSSVLLLFFWYETFISLHPRSSAGIVRSENRDLVVDRSAWHISRPQRRFGPPDANTDCHPHERHIRRCCL